RDDNQAGSDRTPVSLGQDARRAQQNDQPASRPNLWARCCSPDGFGCRIQIEHLAGGPVLHLAELVRRAATAGSAGGVAGARVWQVDLERGAGALAAILDPGPAAVELGE